VLDNHQGDAAGVLPLEKHSIEAVLLIGVQAGAGLVQEQDLGLVARAAAHLDQTSLSHWQGDGFEIATQRPNLHD